MQYDDDNDAERYYDPATGAAVVRQRHRQRHSHSHSHRHSMMMMMVERVVSERAVVIFSVSTCCMCHAVKRLFCGMGVSPAVYELDQHPLGKEIEKVLLRLLLLLLGSGNYYSPSTTTSSSTVVPVVFIGGKLVGAMDRVMASHINGTLVPLLKEAGALWL